MRAYGANEAWLKGCSQQEKLLLIAIASLAAQLPRRLDYYSEAFIEINRCWTYVVEKVEAHNPALNSLLTRWDRKPVPPSE